LHGRKERYHKLLGTIRDQVPSAVFLGGDLLPQTAVQEEAPADFVRAFLVPNFAELRCSLRERYPRVFLILGNDDPRCEEPAFAEGEAGGLWHYVHNRKVQFQDFTVYGLAYVPPTPFLLKDWELYDISCYVPPGCVSPEEGHRSVPAEKNLRWETIHRELGALAADDALDRAIFLFHTPPYDTALDRAALDGKVFEHVPLDVHVGSIAVRRFIEERRPLVTLHGHVHEAARLSGEWKIRLGSTVCLGAAHDGPELALVRFDPLSPGDAVRALL
jgi:Icc-related predicted phosphoesterase